MYWRSNRFDNVADTVHYGELAERLVRIVEGEAVDLLEQDEVVTGWFAPELIATYLRIKRVELDEVSKLSESEQCEWYVRAY